MYRGIYRVYASRREATIGVKAGSNIPLSWSLHEEHEAYQQSALVWDTESCRTRKMEARDSFCFYSLFLPLAMSGGVSHTFALLSRDVVI